MCLNSPAQSRTYSRRLRAEDAAMKAFIDKYQNRIHGVLSCFDRMLFRGYLPIMSGWQMAQFFNNSGIRFRELKTFLVENAERVKQHAVAVANKQGRPFQYLQEKIRKEELARQIAERDGIDQGLVCVFTVLEPCRTFSFRFEKGKPFVASARRKCLFVYFYFMDRDFGLIHVKLQTWFPLAIQIYVNGHEWLARKLQENGIGFRKCENAFLSIDDLARAQTFADRFCALDWPRLLNSYAEQINPLLNSLLKPMSYYWVTAQSEYSTDVLFKRPADLSELYPRLLSHSTLCFGAKEVMSFLGRTIRPQFEGEVVSDVCDLSFRRIPGTRIKHRVKQNWLKMYNKSGSVLRLEMVINEPEGFKVRKQVTRQGKPVMKWVDMRKGVAYLFRYREVSLLANSRYLTALAEVEDPTDAIRTLDRITTRKQVAPHRTAKAFNPLSRQESQIFRALLDGKHTAQGFSNLDIRKKLQDSPHLRDISDPRRQSAKVTRIFNRCHAHGLIAKISHSRRWKLTRHGRVAMAASLQLRDIQFPITHFAVHQPIPPISEPLREPKSEPMRELKQEATRELKRPPVNQPHRLSHILTSLRKTKNV